MVKKRDEEDGMGGREQLIDLKCVYSDGSLSQQKESLGKRYENALNTLEKMQYPVVSQNGGCVQGQLGCQ